jgi:hypothetical protein
VLADNITKSWADACVALLFTMSSKRALSLQYGRNVMEAKYQFAVGTPNDKNSHKKSYISYTVLRQPRLVDMR